VPVGTSHIFIIPLTLDPWSRFLPGYAMNIGTGQ
jgi:hypothetical protein